MRTSAYPVPRGEETSRLGGTSLAPHPHVSPRMQREDLNALAWPADADRDFDALLPGLTAPSQADFLLVVDPLPAFHDLTPPASSASMDFDPSDTSCQQLCTHQLHSPPLSWETCAQFLNGIFDMDSDSENEGTSASTASSPIPAPSLANASANPHSMINRSVAEIIDELNGFILNPIDPIGKFMRKWGLSAQTAIQLNIHNLLLNAPRKPREKYGKRRDIEAAVRLATSRERNREHAKATRARKRIFREIEQLLRERGWIH